MKRSTGRILTSHAGSLVRPAALRDLLVAKNAGRPYDEASFQRAWCAKPWRTECGGS